MGALGAELARPLVELAVDRVAAAYRETHRRNAEYVLQRAAEFARTSVDELETRLSATPDQYKLLIETLNAAQEGGVLGKLLVLADALAAGYASTSSRETLQQLMLVRALGQVQPIHLEILDVFAEPYDRTDVPKVLASLVLYEHDGQFLKAYGRSEVSQLVHLDPFEASSLIAEAETLGLLERYDFGRPSLLYGIPQLDPEHRVDWSRRTDAAWRMLANVIVGVGRLVGTFSASRWVVTELGSRLRTSIANVGTTLDLGGGADSD